MKKLISFALSVFVLINTSVYATEADKIKDHFDNISQDANNYQVLYTDLDDFAWAVPGIAYLSAKNIISGYGDFTFRPQNEIVCKEYIKILTGVAGIIDESAVSSYEDVPRSDWSYLYVSSAYNAGILKIFEGTSLGANGAVTRENIAYMTAKALEYAGFKTDTEDAELFSDDDMISPECKDSVYFLRSIDILNGDGTNHFSPQSGCTRAEAAKIIYTLSEYIKKNL